VRSGAHPPLAETPMGTPERESHPPGGATMTPHTPTHMISALSVPENCSVYTYDSNLPQQHVRLHPADVQAWQQSALHILCYDRAFSSSTSTQSSLHSHFRHTSAHPEILYSEPAHTWKRRSQRRIQLRDLAVHYCSWPLPSRHRAQRASPNRHTHCGAPQTTIS
jgi:hypothetical protein